MHNKIIPYHPALKKLAQQLRRESTLSEVLLWKQLQRKSLGFEFHRQVPIDQYIVDFYCHELMLCIEIDGNSHEIAGVHENDIRRQERLEGFGVRFIRFNDREVKRDINNVVRAISGKIEELLKENDA